jgi:predicted nucleic acid-binding protein
MGYLIDTGVLLRAFDRDAAEHTSILRAIRSLLDSQQDLYVTVQNLAEFWNVSTRPKDAKGGFELPIETVVRRLRVIERLSTVLAESPASFEEWKRLLTTHHVIGVKVHDARLVSVMISANVTTVLTLNVRDFHRYPEITAVTPNEILSRST